MAAPHDQNSFPQSYPIIASKDVFNPELDGLDCQSYITRNPQLSEPSSNFESEVNGKTQKNANLKAKPPKVPLKPKGLNNTSAVCEKNSVINSQDIPNSSAETTSKQAQNDFKEKLRYFKSFSQTQKDAHDVAYNLPVDENYKYAPRDQNPINQSKLIPAPDGAFTLRSEGLDCQLYQSPNPQSSEPSSSQSLSNFEYGVNGKTQKNANLKAKPPKVPLKPKGLNNTSAVCEKNSVINSQDIPNSSAETTSKQAQSDFKEKLRYFKSFSQTQKDAHDVAYNLPVDENYKYAPRDQNPINQSKLIPAPDGAFTLRSEGLDCQLYQSPNPRSSEPSSRQSLSNFEYRVNGKTQKNANLKAKPPKVPLKPKGLNNTSAVCEKNSIINSQDIPNSSAETTSKQAQSDFKKELSFILSFSQTQKGAHDVAYDLPVDENYEDASDFSDSGVLDDDNYYSNENSNCGKHTNYKNRKQVLIIVFSVI